jgi:hypothetical protein
MSNTNVQIEGMKELLKFLGDLGDKAPRQALAKGVRKGANKILNDAKSYSTYKTGLMKSNLYLKTEKGNTRKLKVVIDVTWRPNVDEFVKLSSNGVRYYYPASQEYGFKTKNGGYKEGKYFLKKSRDTNDTQFFDTIEQALNDEIDRLG